MKQTNLMKAIIVMTVFLIFVCFSFSCCGTNGGDEGTASGQTESQNDSEQDTSFFYDFELQVLSICEKYGIGYTSHNFNAGQTRLSDPDVTSRNMLCNMLDGEASSKFSVTTEYYEDPAFAKEKFDQMKESQEESVAFFKNQIRVLFDTDNSIATFRESQNENEASDLMYFRLYDNYLIHVFFSDVELTDTGIAIMNDIEALVNS